MQVLSQKVAGGGTLRNAESVLDFGQGEQPAVGAQVPGIGPGDGSACRRPVTEDGNMADVKVTCTNGVPR